MFRCSRCWKEFEPNPRSNPIICPHCGNKMRRRKLERVGPLAQRFKNGNKKALFNKGVAYQENKFYGEALSCYDEVLKIDPCHTGAWFNKGVIKINLKCYREAVKFFNEVLNIDPNDKDAWYNKGLALGNLGNSSYKEALECYDKVLNIDPSDKDAQNNKDVILLRQEADNDGAKERETKEFKKERSKGPE
jgi:tetratricopeptide (TPR) repeat protein